MAAGKKRKTVEWVGGLASMPAYVTDEGEPYRPEILIWMGADGALLGSAVGKPGEVLGMASASLRETMAAQLFVAYDASLLESSSPSWTAATNRAWLGIRRGEGTYTKPFLGQNA